MGFIVLWVENFAVALLLMGLVTACVGRWDWRWLRVLAWTSVSLIVMFIYIYLAMYVEAIQFPDRPGFHWFYYTLLLAISVSIGVIALGAIGLKRTPDTALPTVAALWPRGKLFAAWCVVLMLHALTIENLDQAAKQQLEAIRSEAIAQIRSAAPAAIPDNDNAAILYESAGDAIGILDPSPREEDKQRNWLDGDLNALDFKDPVLNRFMQERGFIVRMLQEASAKPACVDAPDYSRPFPMPQIRRNGDDLATLLAIHSRWRLAEGDRLAAFRDVNTLFRFAGHTSKMGLSGLARIANTLALRTLKHLLTAIQPTAEELQIVHMDEFWSLRRASLRQWPVLDSQLRWCLQGWGNEQDFPRNFGTFVYPSPFLGKISNSPWYRIFLLQNDMEALDRVSSEMEWQLEVPYWLAAKTAAEGFSWRERMRKISESHQGCLNVAQFAVGYVGNLPQICAKIDGQYAVGLVALAAARYQVKYERLPDKLDALVPEFLAIVPPDPFDGKPIKFKQTDRGVEVYSFGSSKVNDGGVQKDEKALALEGGIVFELPRRPKK
jgi:hypothetical protein